MDSALCASAFHMGALNVKGGDLIIQLRDGHLQYEGSTRNGITSLQRLGNVNIPAITF